MTPTTSPSLSSRPATYQRNPAAAAGTGSPAPAISHAHAMQRTLEYVEALAAQRWWGFITIKLEAGLPVHIRREENIKPENL